MKFDPADTVYTTRFDADTANPDNHPNPVLNNNAGSAENERPSAIERQRVAIQSAAARNRADHNTPPPTPSARFAVYLDGLYHFAGGRFGWRAWIALLVIAAGLIILLSTFHALKKESVPQTGLAQVTTAVQKIPPAGITSEMHEADGIVVPISDVSLRVRPELLQQLVAIYRLRLVADPNNSVATATLSRMREHSLAELDVISATERAPLAADSLRLAVKLFPELASDSRYRSIAARTKTSESNKTLSQPPATAGPAVVTQQPAPATTPPISTQPPAKPLTPATVSTARPADAKPAVASQQPAPATTPALSTQPPQPPTPSSVSTTQTPTAVASRKPQVRVISLTSGIMRQDRFIPANGGNVFRLNIGFRHRDNPLVDQPGAGLVAQLSESGSSKLLAEVPVDIAGSRGEKSFLINTSEKGKLGKFYKLNFIIDGYVLPSHTVQLSR